MQDLYVTLVPHRTSDNNQIDFDCWDMSYITQRPKQMKQFIVIGHNDYSKRFMNPKIGAFPGLLRHTSLILCLLRIRQQGTAPQAKNFVQFSFCAQDTVLHCAILTAMKSINAVSSTFQKTNTFA
ncbi:hypothetical protein SUGI_0439550 [Cryptomeria japonica]|nr:hypothetical protein SUGI_0439550 [Cryptomeria japonica]